MAARLTFITALLVLCAQTSTWARPSIGAWFPDYTSTDLATVRWTDYNELEFFVAITTPDPSKIAFTGMENEDGYIRSFVSLAKQNGVIPTLTVGGWTGSIYVRRIHPTVVFRPD